MASSAVLYLSMSKTISREHLLSSNPVLDHVVSAIELLNDRETKGDVDSHIHELKQLLKGAFTGEVQQIQDSLRMQITLYRIAQLGFVIATVFNLTAVYPSLQRDMDLVSESGFSQLTPEMLDSFLMVLFSVLPIVATGFFERVVRLLKAQTKAIDQLNDTVTDEDVVSTPAITP